MIIRTSLGEFGHCSKCSYDFNSEELWEERRRTCPQCKRPLYKNKDSWEIPERIREANDGQEK